MVENMKYTPNFSEPEISIIPADADQAPSIFEKYTYESIEKCLRFNFFRMAPVPPLLLLA